MRFLLLFITCGFLTILTLPLLTPEEKSLHFIAPQTQGAAVIASFPIAPEAKKEVRATSTPLQQKKKPLVATSSSNTIAVTKKDKDQVFKLENPYPTPPLSFDQVNELARKSLVNIVCTTPTAILQPASGTGVIVHESGVVLTNAHVALYTLLAQDKRVAIDCIARTGSPADFVGTPRVLYISRPWLEKNAPLFSKYGFTETGENDIALLFIERSDKKQNLVAVPIDAREGVAFQGDQVLVGGYPAGFLGGITLLKSLSITTSIATIQALHTFMEHTIDLFSLGGIIVAQSGASGSAVVNQWGKLVGLVVTSSDGATTADRNLRALSTSYIARAFRAEKGEEIGDFIKKDPQTLVKEFAQKEQNQLADLLVKELR